MEKPPIKKTRDGMFTIDPVTMTPIGRIEDFHEDLHNEQEKKFKVLVDKYNLLDTINSPADALRAMAKTFELRGKSYGSDYGRIGRVMQALFPEGYCIDVQDVHAMSVYHYFSLIVEKICRFAASELKHLDSARDIQGYGALLEYVLTKGADDGTKNNG